MDLASQIYVRKSCRNYLDDEINFNPINEFISKAKVLNSNIDHKKKRNMMIGLWLLISSNMYWPQFYQ